MLQRSVHAVLTGKHTLENYLHPTAIQRATGMSLAFSGSRGCHRALRGNVGRMVEPPVSWDRLYAPRRSDWPTMPSTCWIGPAVMYMSRLLGESDAAGEVYAWYRAIKRLAE